MNKKNYSKKYLGGGNVNLDAPDYEVFSIHDTWVKEALLGDVDDLAAIYFLARKYKDKGVAIYIVNDIVHNSQGSRLDRFNAVYGSALRKICPKIIFIGISGLNAFNGKLIKIGNTSTLDITAQEGNSQLIQIMQGSRKIIICAPIKKNDKTSDKSGRIIDAELCDALNTQTFFNSKLYGQSNPIGGGYNFQTDKCELNITNENGQIVVGVGNIMKWYNTDETNRRFTTKQLLKIIGDETFVEGMKKYAIMKTIFLPPIKQTVGLCVSKNELKFDYPEKKDDAFFVGTMFGNNAIGLLMFKPPLYDGKLEIEDILLHPHKLIEKHFKLSMIKNTTQSNMTTDEYVDKILSVNPGFKTYADDIIAKNNSPETTDEVKRRFRYVIAYIIDAMPSLLKKGTPIPTEMYNLQSSIQNKMDDVLEVAKVDVSSPMWDLIAVRNIVDDHDTDDVELKVLSNSMVSDKLYNEIIDSMNNKGSLPQNRVPNIRNRFGTALSSVSARMSNASATMRSLPRAAYNKVRLAMNRTRGRANASVNIRQPKRSIAQNNVTGIFVANSVKPQANSEKLANSGKLANNVKPPATNRKLANNGTLSGIPPANSGRTLKGARFFK